MHSFDVTPKILLVIGCSAVILKALGGFGLVISESPAASRNKNVEN
jgi:hypothetical protein